MSEFLPLLRYILILLCYIAGPFLIIALYGRFKAFSKAGTIVMAYALGIIMSLSGLTRIPEGEAFAKSLVGTQEFLQNFCVPIAIPLMLFSADFKAWTKSLKSTFIAFFCGAAAVTVAVVSAFLCFKNSGIAELDKAAGLMIGFYTGGTPNVASLNIALQPSSETFLLVNTFEIFITFFLLAFLVAGGYKLIRKTLVYKREESLESTLDKTAESFENYKGILSKKIRRPLYLPLLCSLAVFAAAGGISMLAVNEEYRVVSVILLITTFSIALSFIPRIRRTPRMFETGMYFILVFSIIVASRFRPDRIQGESLLLMLFILTVLLLCILLHWSLSKIFKVDADLFTVSLVGLVFSPPFVPTVAGLLKSRRCLISGIVIGLMGYAVGNYLGIAVFWLTRYL